MDHVREDRSDKLLDVFGVGFNPAYELRPQVLGSLFHFRNRLLGPAVMAYFWCCMIAEISAERGVGRVVPLRVVGAKMEADGEESYIVPAITGFLSCRAQFPRLVIYVKYKQCEHSRSEAQHTHVREDLRVEFSLERSREIANRRLGRQELRVVSE